LKFVILFTIADTIFLAKKSRQRHVTRGYTKLWTKISFILGWTIHSVTKHWCVYDLTFMFLQHILFNLKTMGLFCSRLPCLPSFAVFDFAVCCLSFQFFVCIWCFA